MRTFKAAIAAAIFSFCFFVVSSYGADVAKIGVIDLQRVLDQSSAGKKANAEIKKQGKKMETELKEKGAEIEELRERIEREALVMSKEMREEKERDIRIKINDFKSLERKFKQDMQVLNRKFTQQIHQESVELVQEIGKAEGYLLIIEKTVVLYSPNTVDITDQLIQKYNANLAQKTEAKSNTKKE